MYLITSAEAQHGSVCTRVCVYVCVWVELRREGVKIRIRKEEGGLEVLAKVENKAFDVDGSHVRSEIMPTFLMKDNTDIKTQPPTAKLTLN